MSDYWNEPFPNGGFQFRQPQLKWVAPLPLASTFDGTVDQIQKVRLANRALSAKYNLSTDWDQCARDLMDFTYKRLGRPPPGEVPKFWPQPGAAADAVGHIKKAAAGTKLAIQWFGDGGKPVPIEVAERRAAICVECPKNQEGNFWQKLDAMAARSLKQLLELKSGMKLRTSKDDQLQSCVVCDCWNRLKVHTPIEKIRKETSKEVETELPPHCWYFHE